MRIAMTRRIPRAAWARLDLTAKLRFRYDNPVRVTRRLWFGPFIVMWLPDKYVRGNDGLTRPEREALAKSYRENEGRKPTMAEVRGWERRAR